MREVRLVRREKLLPEVGAVPQHLADHVLGVRGGEGWGLQLAQSTVDPDPWRRPGLAVQVRPTHLDERPEVGLDRQWSRLLALRRRRQGLGNGLGDVDIHDVGAPKGVGCELRGLHEGGFDPTGADL